MHLPSAPIPGCTFPGERGRPRSSIRTVVTAAATLFFAFAVVAAALLTFAVMVMVVAVGAGGNKLSPQIGEYVVEHDVFDKVAAVILLVVILLDAAYRNGKDAGIACSHLVGALNENGIVAVLAAAERLIGAAVTYKGAVVAVHRVFAFFDCDNAVQDILTVP